MIVMPSNHMSFMLGYLAGHYTGRIAWLYSPNGWSKPKYFMRFALDNGAYSAYKNNTEWDSDKFIYMVKEAKRYNPMWVAVPDVVSKKDETIELWHQWEDKIKDIPRAFVVQDGMIPEDVPKNADVVFIGGNTQWKWRNISIWTRNFNRVHVGRVNTYGKLWQAHMAGAESCDGTGFFRGDKNQLDGLIEYLEESTYGRKQICLFNNE